MIARPVVRVVRGVSLRTLSVAFGVALGVALVAIPVYVDLATAQFTLRLAFDLGAIVPAARESGFGRDLPRPRARASRSSRSPPLVALFVDRPEREQRSVAELLALPAALAHRGGRDRPPRARRPRGPEVAARARAAARHGAPGRRRDLARRPDRAARALALDRRGQPRRGARRTSCRGSPWPRSGRCCC